MTEQPGPVKIAETLKVVKSGTGPARLYIDGELFAYATADGFTVHPKRKELPGVTLTIAAWRVEVTDDMNAKPAAAEPADGD